jgi:hypothetical protein
MTDYLAVFTATTLAGVSSRETPRRFSLLYATSALGAYMGLPPQVKRTTDGGPR